MATTTISPNMNLIVPTVSEDPGPDWANNINASLSIIDSHNHTSGQGVQINPAGININSDLAMNNYNLTDAKSVRFTAQNSPLAGGDDLGCLYVSGSDLYYNDESANQVRITQGGSVTGSTGTITGLPSGTASASYAASTFTFQSATNTPANMAVGPLIIGANSVSPYTVTLAPSVSQAANYNLVFPLALPVSTSFFNVDTSGNMATVAATGSGSVVLNTAPTFSGVPAGTITGDTFSPTVTSTYSSGAALTITQNTNNWYYLRIGNIVKVQGVIGLTVSGYAGTANYQWKATIPISTTTLVVAGTVASSTGSSTYTLTNSGSTIAVQNSSVGYFANGTSIVVFDYSYQIN